ncbi:hypothetical protein [Noviherbaspirillum denitrificans]|uniref:DNA-binding protein n=1 Tax=Noviherbaspirillum denitrificans TaxID=1968433 RepID=A0A254TCZ0_9BURK|nr:hypothetical protein [Noviherbaspirillum denitrificans]OWW20037.1 hypothetical protein AYR66_11565 [Noviherbaspirillum denitrificans]
MKFHSFAIAAVVAVTAVAAPVASFAQAKAKMYKVEELHKNREALAGKTIQAQGKVVKANNGIRGYNFVHVQDGSGKADVGNHNLIVRSKQTANVGDTVTVSGTVLVNKDMGAGYFYPLLIDEGTVTPKK